MNTSEKKHGKEIMTSRTSNRFSLLAVDAKHEMRKKTHKGGLDAARPADQQSETRTVPDGSTCRNLRHNQENRKDYSDVTD
jgi:hypothetical protein